MTLSFSLQATTPSGARAAVLETTHGTILTPTFMPVGTAATVKALSPDDLRTLRAQMILANTYHLMLRPGIDVIKELGGLHGFMAWHGPILTDSGGFQVLSLSPLVRLTDEGVTFRSHIDGSLHTMTPESVVRMEEDLGVDVAMVLDECPPANSTRDYLARSLERTTAWAKRSLEAQTSDRTALFAIVQGGIHADLRQEHAQELASLAFPGLAIGGLAIGESREATYETVKVTCRALPQDRPRYLMGVGTPEDILIAIRYGVDLFDCVMPTRNARNGTLFTSQGKINIKASRYKRDQTPLDPLCPCLTCQTFSKAYLSHLFRAKELLIYRLLSLHNIQFYLDTVRAARQAILEGSYEQLLKVKGLL